MASQGNLHHRGGIERYRSSLILWLLSQPSFLIYLGQVDQCGAQEAHPGLGWKDGTQYYITVGIYRINWETQVGNSSHHVGHWKVVDPAAIMGTT